jgi:peroxiredoxin
MYPHERSLVDELKKEKFTLLGIDSDSTPTRLRSVIAREKLTWPIIFDGERGPIATRWRIDAYPTTLVLDQKGVIRYRDLRDAELTNAIKRLLAGKK